MKKMYRQGDVLMVQVAAVPANAVAITNEERIVLAHGELTGHAHALPATEAQEYSLADAKGEVSRFLKVFADGGNVRHEEHAPIPLDEGVIQIIQQREFTPETIRNVQD